MSLQFPEEFQVKEEPNQIEFYIPVKIPVDVKDEIIKMQFGEQKCVLLKPKPRAAKCFILTGGTPDRRREILLYILSHVKGEDGKPLFEPSVRRGDNRQPSGYRQMSRAATDAEVAKMIEVANATKEFSYSPYSHFRVGAAVLCNDGSIIGGTNVENCSYPCGSCAERTAIVSAIAQGKKGFKSIAVTADVADDFVTPCGFCRQFIAEFGNLEVILTKGNGEIKKMHIHDLLPMAFTPEDLTK